MSKFRISTQFSYGNALLSEKNYKAGTIFIQALVVTVITNISYDGQKLVLNIDIRAMIRQGTPSQCQYCYLDPYLIFVTDPTGIPA